MKLLNFLRKEAHIPLRRLMVMAIVSGLANALILVVINTSVESAVEEAHSFTHLAMFLVVTGIFIVSQKILMIESWTEVENILQRIRARIVNKIRQCDLEPLEHIGRSQINSSLSRETQAISQASIMLVVAAQSITLLFFALLYVAWLSLMAFVIFVAISGLAMVYQLRNSKRLGQDLLKAMERENNFLDTLSHVLDGFIEVKMNPKRSDDLYDHLDLISKSSSAMQIKAKAQLAKMFVFGQTMLYVLVAAMIFVVPRLSETYNDIIVQAATAMLFLTGPLSTLVSSAPNFAGAGAAITGLENLEAKLDEAASRPSGPPDAQVGSFEAIRFEGIVFQFHHTESETPFTLGPLDLTLEQGEIVFLVGGNGSGKSTFLRLLLGLYSPDMGLMLINGQPLMDANLQAYRNLFSPILSDSHLFERLYGLREIEEERVTALLEDVELAHKVSYEEGRFSTLELSTGQKKRLAFVVSLLENRQIYVFDEWAADQDPNFRKRFYRELLPQLRRQGKTILAVTHDDRYWDVADRLIKMEEGRFIES